MKLALRILLPLLIVGGAWWTAKWFIDNQPEPPRRPARVSVTKVEATRVKPEDYQVILETRGAVRPRTTTTLFPEVSGRIVDISPSFREGGFFEKGDALLKIDPINYETAVVIQESAVAEAQRLVDEEKVRAQQAIDNWKRLGKEGEPSDLVKRVPQLAEANARLRAAQAELERAKVDLKRTELKAPYAGRILEQNVDIGQFVSSGSQLGRAYAIDYVEVRLPLTNRQLAFVDLPEQFRGEAETTEDAEGPPVRFTAQIGRDTATWTGRVVRVDGAIDQMSRQLFVVAQVEDPYSRKADAASSQAPPMKIGLFVDAEVAGKKLENVFVLPRSAVRVGGEVILIDEENRIRRQKVEPLWSDRDKMVIDSENSGLKAGDVVCLTPLAFPANGALVSPTIDGVTPTTELTDGTEKGKGGKGKGDGKKGKGKGEKGDSPEKT
ncbi:MAG: efflux RND transporter periplasmic adaptor subunit [Verrucomicrobiales bacterium]|nr:efflux RND transporter periplasmic adaptor subunit [Verrucomicrobiales bacterium]